MVVTHIVATMSPPTSVRPLPLLAVLRLVTAYLSESDRPPRYARPPVQNSPCSQTPVESPQPCRQNQFLDALVAAVHGCFLLPAAK